MTAFTFSDFFFEVSKGKVAGHSIADKFGANEAISTTLQTVWPEATDYVYSTTADIDTISSANAGDTQDIHIHGLDSGWNLVDQTITLDGQTPVILDTPLIRVNSIHNVGATDLAGIVYLAINGATVVAGVPTTVSERRARIDIGDNRSMQCVYSIPTGVKGYLVHRDLSAGKGADVSGYLKIREFGEVFQTRHRLEINNSPYEHQTPLTEGLPAKADIEIRAKTATGSAAVSSSFVLILVELGYLPSPAT